MPRALIVEDDLHTVALLTMLLKRLGFETLTADNVPDAQSALAGPLDLDLIVLDILLPGLSGTKLL
ncbi:MAG: response regulator, partial [Chloroflexota bacterium]